jgi:penicillin-binding protein 1A
LLLFLFAALGVFGKMPSIIELQNPEADLASEIYSADGKLMGKFYAENRSEITYSKISPHVIHALIATEDERFYDHSGIDAEAVGRVVFTGGKAGGGSTLTQQLAKMMLGQGRSGSFILKRGIEKVKEWIVAVRLEKNFTKEEIIALYLNHAPWGNVYGIRNASRTYYQKEPSELKLEEAAVLVGMLKGFIYDPVRHPEASLKRRNVVIQQMVQSKQHYLTQEQANVFKQKLLVTNFKKIDLNVGIAPYFRSALAQYLKDWCKKHKNPKTDEPYDIYRDGLKIYTTIDSRMQAYAEQAVEQHMPQLQSKLYSYLNYRSKDIWKGREAVIESAMKFTERWKIMQEEGKDSATIRKTFDVPVKMKIFSWWGDKNHERDTVMTPYDSIKYHKQLLQTSFVSMEPSTGEVKAWVGGINYKWFKYDHVTSSRQVGSTFKPLLYTLAVTDAGYNLESYIEGGAVTMLGKTISFGGGTMAHCLAKSINGAAWRLMRIIGVRRTVEFAKACGITARIPPYPSIALGSADIPMIQMLQSYTMFPNKGYNTTPIYVTRIEDKNGTLIQEFSTAQTKELISEAEAYTMVKMMQGVVEYGTGQRLKSYDIPVQKAGKTGTTNGNTDGWFIGYTPELLAGTWVGCEDPFIPIYSNNSGGAEMAAPKWGLFMSRVYGDRRLPYSKVEFEQPVELKNDPIFADANFADIVNRGDSLESSINNGTEDDFFSFDSTAMPDEGAYDENIPVADTPKNKKLKSPTPPKKD